jgi:uncharacterized Ntn-hydrolase superfamily protein
MTFSIVGRSPDGSSLGVAVASKFLAAGAYVPAAAADAGAIATQSFVNVELRTRGIEMLRQGVGAAELFERFFGDDPRREQRQAGVVDRAGAAATFTGSEAMPWAGGRTGEGPDGSFAAQGNLLAGPEVVDAMVDAWSASVDEPSLARRLVDALEAGQAAGGDPRGKQSAAVLVVSAGGGYGGLGDVLVDLRSDDSGEPIGELWRMLDLHDLYFGSTPDEELLDVDGTLEQELTRRLASTGYASGDLRRDLYDWMGRENFEERWRGDRLDPVVLRHLRATTPASQAVGDQT